MTIDQGKEKVAKLCQYFATNREVFLAPGINEAHVRQSLIDPMFEALGWDVSNRAMTAPQYREVIPEDSLDVEGHQKAPDYTFRVGTLRKFYAEAKKCAVNIGTDPAPAFQLRRYGFSGKLALSILTNFEELGIYDCTTRPNLSDKASHARIQHFRYDEYPDRWHELWDVFSREAVWSGTFDRYAASKRKRGTSEVDVEFLNEMEGWRLALAGNIALRNKSLSLDDLNAAVQLTIDRVIFLRMAEDRGLEPYEQLLKLCERPDIYSRFMRSLCRQADEKYNSGLFHFQKEGGVSEDPDRITPRLVVDDKIFKSILQSLYFAYGSPYHFGVMPVEILGTVYERFLGKVIRLTAGHQAKIEEKPEVRKAGGVYYTPAYIVEYIVSQTVGQQIKGQSPDELAGSRGGPPLRVLDMACGSGSFLLGAYRCLLDYCLNWYTEHKPEKFKRAVYKDSRTGWRLTVEERKRILITHIFGVDIDPQAVEVTKLSLLLKVLEGETDQSLSLSQLTFAGRALPNLADNIRCGNSLVGTDYFTDKLFSGPEELKRVNAFNWNEGFPDAASAGGFDCIIGNPPYIDSELMTRYYPEERSYCAVHYTAARGNWDVFCVFIEKALELCKNNGLHSFIVPNKLTSAEYAAGIRTSISTNQLLSLRDYSKAHVFPVAVYPVIYVIRKSSPTRDATVTYERIGLNNAGERAVEATKTLPLSRTVGAGKAPWAVSEDSGALSLVSKLAKSFPRLATVATVCGAATVAEAYELQALIAEKPVPTKGDVRLVNSGTIDRYANLWGLERCRYLGASFLCPVVPAHRLPKVSATRTQQSKRPKLIVAGMTKRLECIADMTGDVMAGKSTSLILPVSDLRYLLGVMNSRLIDFYYKTVYGGNALQGGYLRIGPPQLKEIPIRCLDPDNSSDRAANARMLKLVRSIETLKSQQAAAKAAANEAIIQRQIDAVDAEIDRLVYDLYGLTVKEIALVEGTAAELESSKRE